MIWKRLGFYGREFGAACADAASTKAIPIAINRTICVLVALWCAMRCLCTDCLAPAVGFALFDARAGFLDAGSLPMRRRTASRTLA
jgi:hypothetical protein